MTGPIKDATKARSSETAPVKVAGLLAHRDQIYRDWIELPVSAGEIEIQDTKSGIPENFIARIFDPFFTTEPVGKETAKWEPVHRSIADESGRR